MTTNIKKNTLKKAVLVLLVTILGVSPKVFAQSESGNTKKSVDNITSQSEFFDWEFSDIDDLTQSEREYYLQERETNLKEIEEGKLTKVAYNNRMQRIKGEIIFTRDYPLVLQNGGACTFGSMSIGGGGIEQVLFEKDRKIAMEKHGFLARNGVIEIKYTEEYYQRLEENWEETAFVSLDKAEKMPEFVGGEKALQKYLLKNVKYPANETASAHVVVKFTIRNDGKVVIVGIAKSSKIESFDNEAIRVVENMPDWVAGENNGKKVNVQLNLPIYFKK